MMSGVLIALWAVPVLTAGRLLFNVLMTMYVFVGLYFEERTLSAELGADYQQYQKTTPSVIPGIRRKRAQESKCTSPDHFLLIGGKALWQKPP
ncbi:MAG: isoprenylcysteine carboxylmethyltransferase family protein [Granulosicoccus sp.]